MQTPLIRIQSVSKIYRMGTNVLYALNQVNLDVMAGEFLVITGPSGSGKSTLMNLIGAIDRPTEGEIWFLNDNLTHASSRALTLYRRDHIGFVFQFYNLLPTLTAKENVEVSTVLSKDTKAAMDALQLVGLDPFADHFPAQMSGGQQQRVAIARAIASNPDLLLCDEPTGALDSKMGRQIMALLVRVCKELKKTIVMVTHDDQLAKVGDRIAVIRDGQLVEIVTQENPWRPEDK